ncbi:hypothetical protein [Lysobacter enzymogenes]|uniref:hypothetical protein n=1 Tax=Lysobacter enzymogenes TaxID=69 RepID=UPI0019D0B759|nr:hypothetical protein [Lysobacter enzymogenes]
MNNNGIVSALKTMAGARNRCMYCGDSEGCDIEHFRPKSVAMWRGVVFQWTNFLWICAPCNRLKNSDFSLDAGGCPLMLDPSIDRVWDFFDYVDESGQLAPRFDLCPDREARASYTLREDVSRLLYDIICESRQRSARIIRRAVLAFLASARGQEDQDEFVRHVLDSDYPELCEWFFESVGGNDVPYSELREDCPDLIVALKGALNARYPGIW